MIELGVDTYGYCVIPVFLQLGRRLCLWPFLRMVVVISMDVFVLWFIVFFFLRRWHHPNTQVRDGRGFRRTRGADW